MGELAIGEEVAQPSWRWHHEVATFAGAMSLIDALYECTSTDHPMLGVPFLMFGTLAMGHALGGSRAADYHAYSDNH